MSFPFSRPDTRSTPLWALVLLLFAFWALAQAAAIPFILPLLAVSGESASAGIQTIVIVLALFVSSAALAAGPVIWAGRQEFRDLAELGIRLDDHGWRQYGRGWWIGALYWFALVLLAALLTHFLGHAGVNETKADWSRLADPSLMALLVILFFAFAVQGAAEEILCRGWLMTNVTAKMGIVRGVLISSALFAGLHPQYFFNQGMHISEQQILVGIVGLLAIFTMGLMLAMLSVRDRSIMGAAGMHSSFNFLLIGGSMVFSHVASDQSVAEQFTQSLQDSTSLTSVQPALVVQILLSLFVAGVIYWRFGFPKDNRWHMGEPFD